MAETQPGPRQQRILRAVVHEYIRTAQPVSSDTLVRRYRLGVSSATVRNDLAELEDLGLLTHPHTSADWRTLSSRLAEQVLCKDAEAMRSVAAGKPGHSRAILEAAGRLLDEQDDPRALSVYVDGVMNLLRQPEFTTSEQLRDAFTIL